MISYFTLFPFDLEQDDIVLENIRNNKCENVLNFQSFIFMVSCMDKIV